MNVMHDRDNHVFLLRDDSRTVGRLEYEWDGTDTIRATHTHIPTKFRGQNLGDYLFKALMEFVNEEKLTLIPVCPYVERKLQRMETAGENKNDT